MRRIAVLMTLAAALAAVSSADAGFRPINRDFAERTLPRLRAGVVHVPSGQQQGRVQVIVRLAQPPLAVAEANGLASGPTSGRLSVGSAGAKAYLARLERLQRAAIAELRRAIPEARVDRRFRIVLDGITVTLPARKLPRLVRLRFADKVYPSLRYTQTLDASPQIIGAPQFTAATGDSGQGVKIAIVDTGVDPSNPFFNPAGYTYPAGFPRGGRKWTSPKVIVARAFPGPASGAQGRRPLVLDEFHGTHVAGIAAGNAGTRAPASPFHPAVVGLSGVAPQAWIGNYRVFTVPTPSGRSANTPEIVAAFESAVADGMDVINFSGGGPMTEPANDALVEAVHNVAAAGVVPVIAAGNDRDDFGLGSVGSPGTAPDAISVAAVTNSHIFAQALAVTAPDTPPALTQIAVEGAAGQRAPAAWATADQTLVEVGSIVGTDGRAVDRYLCAPAGQNPNDPSTTLPRGSLAGAVVLVARGRCAFTSKAARAKAAGARGLVLVDNRAGDPNPIPVEMPIPSGMISDLDGARLEAYLVSVGGRTTMRVGRSISEILNGRSGVVTSFSSAGPTDFGHELKPDVAAPGSQILSSTPPGATSSTFSVLDGTSMATPHVAGAAALLLQRHPAWTPQQVKSALVSTGGPAWADTERSNEASVLLEGGGLIGVGRADDPRLFTDPTSLSFGDLDVSRGARSKPLLLALSDAGNGAGDWQVQLQVQTATAGVSLDVQPTVSLAPGATAYVAVVARATADATPGDESGFVLLRQGAIERRVPYFFLVTRPGLPLGPPPLPLRKAQVGDTRVGRSHVNVYRYPLSPFGPPPTYSGPAMDESGAERVYRVEVDGPAVNVGVSILAASPGSLVHPWFLGSLDENDVQGYAGTPVDVNDFTFDARFDVGAAGAVFPRQKTFYVAVDSGTALATGRALPGRYLLNAWIDDVSPPKVQLVTKRVAAGRPLLVARVSDAGAGVDPFSLAIAYRRVLLGAAFYDPTSGYALFPLPADAPRLVAGTTPTLVVASDFQEAKNIDTFGHEVLPNTTFQPDRVRVVDGPAVTWLRPEALACVRGRVGLTATASSTRPVRNVRFLVDGRRLAVAKSTGGLYSAVWKSAGATKGRHVLRAVVTDAASRSAFAERGVRVCRS